jgi:hypothetical protein
MNERDVSQFKSVILPHHPKIGAGGMGEANLAEDTKLQHKLALKILPGND